MHPGIKRTGTVVWAFWEVSTIQDRKLKTFSMQHRSAHHGLARLRTFDSLDFSLAGLSNGIVIRTTHPVAEVSGTGCVDDTAAMSLLLDIPLANENGNGADGHVIVVVEVEMQHEKNGNWVVFERDHHVNHHQIRLARTVDEKLGRLVFVRTASCLIPFKSVQCTFAKIRRDSP